MKAMSRVEAETKCPKCGFINKIDFTQPRRDRVSTE